MWETYEAIEEEFYTILEEMTDEELEALWGDEFFELTEEQEDAFDVVEFQATNT
jgi:hypothetical protein